MEVPVELAERYAYRVYTAKSFTAAAKELYISQPALSAMITKLEKSLGFRIFDRSSSPLSLTPAGRVYIEYLQNIIAEEGSMRQRIRQLSESESESLSVSIFSQTAYYMFPALCSDFSIRYPNVSITADIGNNSTIDLLIEKLRSNALDIILTDHMVERDFLSIPIYREQLLIAVKKNLCADPSVLKFALTREEALSGSYDKHKELTSLSLLGDIPFLSFDEQTTTAQILSSFSHNEWNPSRYHIKNSRNLMMHYYMMREGLGATIVDASHLTRATFNDPDIVYFVPSHPSAYRPLYGIIQESRQNDPMLMAFINQAKTLLNKQSSALKQNDLPE